MKYARKSKIYIQMILGAITTIVVNVGIALVLMFLGPLSRSFFGIVALLIGIVQLIYILPICHFLDREGYWDWLKGVIIGAVITALINIWFVWQGLSEPPG